MIITFADNNSFEVVSIKGRDEMTSSVSDTITKSDREVMEIIIDGTMYNDTDVEYYYLNPDNCSKIVITDDNGNTFTHLDYVIPVKFGTEYINGNVSSKIILIMAQLTETDKTLREVAGKVQYVGSELEISKAKKINKSKKMLAEWLENNPLIYTDGNSYSVTEEKQALLNGNLASYRK